MKNRFHLPRRRGFALLLVLIIVTFCAAIALLFLLSAQQERTGTDSYAQGSRVRELADTAINLVMGQINAATKQGTAANPVSWASQPGMIRTYDTTGSLKNAFKLYSWNNLVESNSNFNPSDPSELPPANWSSQPAVYTDLNQPVNNIYPIVDPAAATQVEDFSIDSTNVAVSGSANNAAPMPVQWLYVLQDGSWIVPAAGAGNSVTVTGATATNPIVGRIAFWTDDETAKVNINTASEGAYWDWPKSASADEMQFAGNPPVKNEFNRVSGHPATTCLSAVFPEMRNGTFNRWSNVATYAQQLQDIFSISPRIAWSLGGSQGGTYPISSYAASYAPTYGSWIPFSNYSPITLDADRLYATTDDAWFQPNHANANVFTNYGITAQDLSQRLFFLSADSTAPETTLFETPRVSLWPITYPYLSSYWSNFSTNATLNAFRGRATAAKPTTFPSPNTTANPLATLAAITPYASITPQERLIGLCSTLDTANTALTTPNNYYFQRQDPDSPTNDWNNITRNQNLVNYLRAEMGEKIPGIGSSLSSKWEGWTAGDTDWIALNCFDFSRSLINQYTYDPSSTTGNLLYSYTGIVARDTSIAGVNKQTYSEPNAATVVPLHITPTTSAFTGGNTYVTEGAYPTLKEASVMFYATARNLPIPPTLADGTTIDGNKVTYPGEWKNLISYTPPLNTSTNKSQTTTMQGIMLFSFAQMNPGTPNFFPVFWIKVTPKGGSFTVNGTGINLPPAVHNSIQWNTYLNNADTSPTYGPLFYKQYNQPKIFSNAAPTTPTSPGTLAASSPTYYTLISNPITVNPNTASFTFAGTNVEVDVYAPYSSNLDIDPTADPAQLVSSQQIDFSKWTQNTLPTPLAPRWNVCQQAMKLTGTLSPATGTGRLYAGGVPMPDPGANGATLPPVATDPLQPKPPAGWQAEVVPQIYSFSNVAGLMNADNLSLALPSYVITPTGSGTTGYGVATGDIPYVYTGTTTVPTGSTGPTLTYTSAWGSSGISTDIRCRVAGLAQRLPITTPIFLAEAAGNGTVGPTDPFSVSVTYNDVQGYTLITPYDTVISMVSDPTTKIAGDPRLMGRGIHSTGQTGTTSFIPITTALAGSNSPTPNHVIQIGASNTVVTSSGAYAVFPPRSTDQAQYHQLGWPGPSGFVSEVEASVPMDTGYLTMPTFGGGTNYMAIRGAGTTNGVLGSTDKPGTAVSVEGNVTMSLNPNSDWTSMPGISFDGGYISRPDQDYQALAQDYSSTTYQMVPYFQTYGTYSFVTTGGHTYPFAGALFMPNRQVPSPVILGTLPSDLKTGWQTLAFSPNPAETMNGAGTHPGTGILSNLASPAAATGAPYTSPPDHLLLDLFWMPVAEPYPISSQFATAGKVNLNYAMMPFPYILRKTALDAVLKSVWLYAIPFTGSAATSTAAYYKSFYHMMTYYGSQHTRYPIAVNETLKAFDNKFSTGDIFRSASQICDMFLYPSDPTKSTGNNPLVTWDSANANITGWWKNQQLTSDNGREEPYNAIYSRVTTKSNTYTIHWRVQALQKANISGNSPSTWTEGTDIITSELRGSTLVERYLDPNATNIPDYANPTTAASALPLSNYYKWRVDSETYFQPSP